MKLILARHGNTFGPQDKVTWVGSTNDLPLVEEGLAQAERFGDALKNEGAIAAIYCAPLLRTKQFAEIITNRLRLAGSKMPVPFIVDERLTELDYGKWSGRSDAEIEEQFGKDCLTEWIDKSIWPEKCGWAGSPEFVETQVRSFVEELLSTYPEDCTVIAVSSNGRLRYFLKLVGFEFEKRVAEKSFKVATGRKCVIDFSQGKATVSAWNEKV
jgi:broad specificity phosphatase PhoE